MRDDQKYWTVVLVSEYNEVMVTFQDVVTTSGLLAIEHCRAQMANPKDWLLDQMYVQGYKVNNENT